MFQQAIRCTVIFFRSILQGVVHLRMCEQRWQSVVESQLSGKLFHRGVEIQRTAATYPSHGLPEHQIQRHLIFFSCGCLLRDRPTGHQYVIWQIYKKEFMLLSTMSHHRCFITHGMMLNTGWTFPESLMEAKLRFMEHNVKKIPVFTL